MMKNNFLLATAMLTLSISQANCEEPPIDKSLWESVLSRAKPKIPADPNPAGEIVWRTDFSAALVEAKATGRPLLVTWRCLPCEQCSEFDKEILDGSPTLDPLLRRFITVRLTDASLLDERYFPYQTHQDLDLSWWAYFLSSRGDLYGVFGGKDHVSENTRISEEAFINNLERILSHHYNPQRKDWDIDLPVGHASVKKTGPRDLKGYELLVAKRPGMVKPHREYGSCIHCHQVGDMLTIQAVDTGAFQIEQLTQKWPLPENVGIHLKRDDGLLVDKVTVGSPAARAGLRAGDRLGMASGTRLFGQADFRGALHRADYGKDTINIAWTRGDNIQFGELAVQPGWRENEHWWRKTVYDGVYGPTMGFFPLKGPNAGKDRGLSIRPWMGPKAHQRPVYQTGLRPNMEIISINDMSEELNVRELITWFRLNHQPGDEVVYEVRGGKKFRYQLPQE